MWEIFYGVDSVISVQYNDTVLYTVLYFPFRTRYNQDINCINIVYCTHRRQWCISNAGCPMYILTALVSVVGLEICVHTLHYTVLYYLVVI